MSHFRVTAITQTNDPDELDALLDPYDENKHQVETTEEDGETYKHNPRAKWDWWVVGGRWPEVLLDVDGRKVAQARRDRLDVAAMRSERAFVASNRWASWDVVCRDLPVAPTWAEVREAHPGDIDSARAAWRDIPRVAAMRALDSGEHLATYQTSTREAYVELEVALAVPGWALLTAEAWIELGSMGWWGMNDATTESKADFAKRANAVIDSMPGSWWVTAVDCHI